MDNNDILQEVEEEMKQDKILNFIKTYYKQIIAGIVVISFGIMAYLSNLSESRRIAEEFTKKLTTVFLKTELDSDYSRELEKIISNEEAPKPIKQIATTIQASNSKTGIEELKKIANDSSYDTILRDLAKIGFVYRSLDNNDLSKSDEIIKILEEMSSQNGPFKLLAVELLGVISFSNKNFEKAKEYFELIVNSKDAPRNLKTRAKMFLNSLN